MRNKLILLAVTLALLAGTMALFEFTTLDLWVQDHFFDFAQHRWWVDKQARLPKLLFYTGPKVVLGVAGGLLIGWLLLPARWRPAGLELPWPKRRLWLVLLSLAIVPVTIGVMKSRSDLHCPWAIIRYGGAAPYLHFFEPLPAGLPPDCGNCFPAGHASGGFALLGLYYLFNTRRGRLLGLTAAMIYGWSMGLYQMFKGAHFLSHTLVTMWLAALIVQVLALGFKIDPAQNSAVNNAMTT
jgi:membrane-associated PAP2 superfamily phosphatase